MTSQKRAWSDLSPTTRTGIVVLSLFEMVFTFVAARDPRKRPAAEVKGPKFLWLLALAVQPVGPLAYLAVGRRRNGA